MVFSEKYGLEASESVHIQRRSYFLAIFKIDVTSLKYKEISDKRKLSETMRQSERHFRFYLSLQSCKPNFFLKSMDLNQASFSGNSILVLQICIMAARDMTVFVNYKCDQFKSNRGIMGQNGD